MSLCVSTELLFVLSTAESVQCAVDPGRQTLGCRPKLEVLNLGLGTLVGWAAPDAGRGAPVGPRGLRSGALLNCLLAGGCTMPEGWRWEKEEDWSGAGAGGRVEAKVGSWGSGAVGAGGGGGDRGEVAH